MKRRFISALLVLSLVFCGVVPAYAIDASQNSVPEGSIALTEEEMARTYVATVSTEDISKSPLNAPKSDIAPLATGTSGARVLSLAVYPLYENTETGARYYNSSFGRKITYGTSSQSETIRFSNASTIQLLDDVEAYLAGREEEFELVGWYFTSSFLFESSRPRYALYHPTPTYTGSTEEVKHNITSTSYTMPISGSFLFPENGDPRTDYYYIGFDGAYYYQASSGLLGILFGGAAAFNSKLGT